MRKIIFLDRDGVINRYPGDTKYVTTWRQFKFLPGVKTSIKRLNKAGYSIFIISNQAGVTKGIYAKKKLNLITKNMLSEIKNHSGEIKKVFYCIHTSDDNCSCRKPRTGLIKEAFRSLGIRPKGADLKNIFYR